MLKGDVYKPITKKRVFGLLNLNMDRPKGKVLANVRSQVNNADGVAPKELGKVVRGAGELLDGYYVKMKF